MHRFSKIPLVLVLVMLFQAVLTANPYCEALLPYLDRDLNCTGADPIGQGASGSVYLVRGDNTPLFAFKIQMIENTAQYNQAAVELKFLEAVDHPNIIKQIKFLLTEEVALSLMEFAGEGDLRQYLRSHRSLFGPEEKLNVVGMFRQIVTGVQFLHSCRLIHRDLKTANVVLRVEFVGGKEKLIAKIIDPAFGVELGAKGISPAGTPNYIDPESMSKRTLYTYGPHTDVYSLGVILYEMLTFDSKMFVNPDEMIGDFKVDDQGKGIKKEKPKKIDQYVLAQKWGKYLLPLGLDTRLVWLINRMTLLNPGFRPTLSQVQEILEDIEKNVDGTSCSQTLFSNQHLYELPDEANVPRKKKEAIGRRLLEKIQAFQIQNRRADRPFGGLVLLFSFLALAAAFWSCHRASRINCPENRQEISAVGTTTSQILSNTIS